MNALASGHDEPTTLDSMSGTGGASRKGIRDLLRDTALLVTTLTSGGEVRDGSKLRNQCKQLIEHFSAALERRGYPDDVRQEAVIAQCGLLDETMLRSLPTEMRAGWELEPLQVEQFNLHDAGESVFDRLEVRMREMPPHVDLLECYSAILGMGFTGRYAREGEAKRTTLIATLNAQIEKLHPSSERPVIADRAGRQLSDWFYRLSPWAIAGLACLAAVIVWAIWSTALDAQLAHLVPAKGLRP